MRRRYQRAPRQSNALFSSDPCRSVIAVGLRDRNHRDMWRTAIFLIVAQLPNVAGPASQAAPGSADYYRLVANYLESKPDWAVAELVARAPHSPAQMRSMLQGRWTEDTVHDLEIRRAAALLEAEAGFASGSMRTLTARLGHARSWIHSAKPSVRVDPQDTFRQRWFVAVGRKTIALAVAGAADEMLENACDTYSDNASLWLVYGAARELTAIAEDGTRALEAVAAGVPPRYIPWFQPQRRTALSDAKNAFQRALALQPDLVEAQVRLASVLVALGDDRAAEPVLDRVLASAPPHPYGYVAAMLLGDIRARNDQRESAIELYVRARGFSPGAQSPYIAHARSLRLAGNQDGAASVIAEMLARPSPAADPWTRYPLGFDAEAADLSRLRPLLKAPR